MAHEVREILLTYPEVTQVVSQMGRPDDGTDVTTFNNIEFMVTLKNPERLALRPHQGQARRSDGRAAEKYPGIDFNFSQNIQDNVEEAMSGVKGENSLKLFGDDIDTLVEKAGEIRDIMAQVPGIADLGVFQETGQPRTADFDRPRRERALRTDGRGRERGRAGGDRRHRCHGDSGRRPALRFRDPLQAGISRDARSHPQHSASHARREPACRSARSRTFRCKKAPS